MYRIVLDCTGLYWIAHCKGLYRIILYSTLKVSLILKSSGLQEFALSVDKRVVVEAGRLHGVYSKVYTSVCYSGHHQCVLQCTH